MIAFILTIAVIVLATGIYFYKTWREQQEYEAYHQGFQQRIRSQVDDASRYISQI